ncbi:MAG: tetratricopeptide repeat protein [Myxococcota bacterium]
MAIDRERALRTAEKYAARNRYKQAIEQYQMVLQDTPADARVLLKVGDLYARTQAHARALDAYARAGRVYADEGFAAKAVAVYKQVQQIVDEDAPLLADYFLYVYPTLAHLYQELRLPVEALGMYDAYASMLARCGRLREAATVLGIVVDRGGDSPLTRLRLAEVLLEEGELDEARAQFVEASHGLERLGRIDEAMRVLDHTFARMPEASIARRAAEVLLNRGQGNDGMQALVWLQQAFTAEPKNLTTLALLARAFEAIDQPERAFEVRKETVRIAKEQGALDAAREVLTRLQQEAPEDPAVRSLVLSLTPPSPPEAPPQSPPQPPPKATPEPPSVLPEDSIPEVSAELIAPMSEASFDGHTVAVDADMPVIEEIGLGIGEDEAPPVPSSLLADVADAGGAQPAPRIPDDVLREESLVGPAAVENLRGFRGSGDVGDAIEEAEFFASRGLFDDALAILEEQCARFPDDAELRQRLDDVREQARSTLVVQPSVLGVSEPTMQASRLTQGADPAFLETALADLQPSKDRAYASVDLDGGKLDVDVLFDAFKQGIAEQVDEQDSRMQYDLGLAYLEMGKQDAAVEAFRAAAQDPLRACVSLSMVASVHRDRGALDAAMEALQQAAEVPRKTREEEVGVQYELASLHEQRGEMDRAIEHFGAVVRLAPDFRDARARLAKLRGKEAHPAERSVSDDEFDRAFDGLFAPSGNEDE